MAGRRTTRPAPGLDASPAVSGVCPLCSRQLGHLVERHHLIPKTFGGRDTVALHPICHRQIHTTFSDKEIADIYRDMASLRAHPDIAAFIRWLRHKHPDFYRRTENSRIKKK